MLDTHTYMIEMIRVVKKTSCKNDFVTTYFTYVIIDICIPSNHGSQIQWTDHFSKFKISGIFLVCHWILHIKGT